MFKSISIALAAFLCLTIGVTLGDPTEKCTPRNQTYSIPDAQQCDLYWECLKNGKLNDRLCEDGLVFAEDYRKCDYPHNVDCSKRPKLQPTTSVNPMCPRANGFYAFPSEISCQKFYHCLEGKAYEKTCPEGVIFDDKQGTCVQPDMAKRTECSATAVLNFDCPNAKSRFSKLKFGDHDRHAHPDDCRAFYICLMDGKPRLGGCPRGKVFNSETGFCDKPKNVEDHCKDWYNTEKGKLSANDIIEMEREEELARMQKKNRTIPGTVKEDGEA